MSDLILSSRRGFLTGLGAALITAPAIVRATSIMPVKAFNFEIEPLYGISPGMAALIELRALEEAFKEDIRRGFFLPELALIGRA